MEVSEEGIKTKPRGVRPGDRWALLEKTSPSGKAMFRCMSCGLETVSPNKLCFKPPESNPPRGEPNVDCITWMPEKLFRYHLPNDESIEGWAHIIISNKGYFSAVSDYGNYAFYWSHHGMKDFRQFLVRIHKSWDYVASKLGSQEYSGEKTYNRVKEHILQERRAQRLSREEARREFSHLVEDCDHLDSPRDFERWYMETKIEEAWEFYSEAYPASLQAFCKKTLKRLSEILEVDLRREGLLDESILRQ